MVGMNSGVARNALVLIAAITGAYALFWLREILTPLALAIFLLAMVDGLARLLAQRAPFIPDVLALPLALLGSVIIAGLVVYAVTANAAGFAQELLNDTARLNQIIARIAGIFGVRVPPTLAQLINQLNPIRYMGDVARALQSFASGAIYVLVYLGFLIASRQGFQKKAVALFPVRSERAGATEVFYRIRDSIQRYLWIQTVTGLLIAGLSAVVMYGVGLSNALFWSFLILVLSFVPVIGGAIGSTLPPLFALVQFPTTWRAVVLFAGLQAIGFVVGNVIQPRMQRDSLNIDPVMVLLSLALWGALWGLPGMFLSTPLTVTVITILAQFEGSRWIAILLSGDGAPEGGPRPAPPDIGPWRHRLPPEGRRRKGTNGQAGSRTRECDFVAAAPVVFRSRPYLGVTPGTSPRSARRPLLVPQAVGRLRNVPIDAPPSSEPAPPDPPVWRRASFQGLL